MPTLSGAALKRRLQARQFKELFVEELGWDRLASVSQERLVVDGAEVRLEGMVQKRAVPVYLHRGSALPDRHRRQRIERELSRRQLEHLVVFLDETSGAQVWQWVKREPGRPDRVREHAWRPGDDPEALRQKLDVLQFTLEEEEAERITVSEVTNRLKRGFDADRVTKGFYTEFKAQHDALLAFLKRLPDEGLRSWYASVILNRLMFVYFIQKKGFIDGNTNYLNDKLTHSKAKLGRDRFFSGVLGPLFFRGFALPKAERTAADKALLGNVPYLNGGLFQEHQIERNHGDKIALPDKAFEALFAFFDGWRWHLDERGAGPDAAEPSAQARGGRAGQGREINPDVLGYIFEKYVNQKQMGAYYTKEDITDYICSNTILPRLLDKVREQVPIAFKGEGSIWRLLCEDSDRYIWPSVRHGVDRPLPEAIAAGVADVSKRSGWDRPAGLDLGLPTETWREVVHRRERCEALRARMRAGELASPDALVTANLDTARFVQDAIQAASEDALKAWWSALSSLTVLDPACGSGAFLFAALNLLEPLYTKVFEAMQTTVADARRGAEAGGRPFEKARYKPLTDVLDEAARHANSAYFVLRHVALSNLYGVDIMEEAAEICKLRLFLKLVAQLDNAEKIEPLPDLDFNIRSGNSLVGVIADRDFDRVKQKPLDFGAIRLDIREKGEVAALAYDKFRTLQIRQDSSAAEIREVKADLERRLEAAAASSNRWIARQYGANPDQKLALDGWIATHEPFNWWTEFMGVMRKGGFDTVVGNPPYVSRTKVSYRPAALDEPSLSDIYGNFVLRAFRLIAPEGRCGLIVPMSLTFSEDFTVLRDALKKQGTNWLSSYDNIPAALFSGVSQRCTIWLHAPSKGPLFTSIMQRWRAEYRDPLLETTTYYGLKADWPSDYGVPKLCGSPHERVLAIIAAKAGVRPDRVFGARTSKHALGFATAARNFISVFDKLPPELDADTLKPIAKSKASFVAVAQNSIARAALAITAGDAFFWYWLVRGDGFDVTGWIVRSYIGALGALDQETLDLLAEIGELITERRNECLVFKKNAGKYVGNMNYSPLAELRRAADELFLAGIGAPAEDRETIYDHVRRVLAINESAGEKAIPAAVKAKFLPIPFDGRRQHGLLQRVQSHLKRVEIAAA